MNNHLPSIFQQYIHKSKYSRWLWEDNRRETWEETVDRYFNFYEDHLKENNNFTLTKELRSELEEAILSLKVMPSMRCLMTAGEALKRENVAGYNCCYIAIDNPRSFDEILYILMNGTGVGFSVEQKYTQMLPVVAEDHHPTDTKIVVADSKLGWAKALRELISLLYSGNIPQYDLSKLRPAGAVLKTFGGRSAGPGPLEDLFKFTIALFKKAAGRRLTSLECHDLVCKVGDIVVSGGVRRSALISLSDLSDDRMRLAKSGEWWTEYPQRALANNSFVINDTVDVGIFMKEWLSLYESHSGERGIFSRLAAKRQVKKFGRRNSDFDFGCNPCFTGETLIAVADGRNAVSIKELSKTLEPFPVYSARRAINKKGWVTEIKNAIAQKTGTRPIVEVLLSNGGSFRVTEDHQLALPHGGYIRTKDSKGIELEGFFTTKNKNYRMINTVSDGNKYQHRMIWEHHNGKKEYGYHIDHVIPNGNDSINNLQLLEENLHNSKTGVERLGKNNPVHSINDVNSWKQNISNVTFMENNPRYSSITDEEIISAAINLKEQGLNITFKNLNKLNWKMPQSFSKNRFGGSIRNLRKIVNGEIEYIAPTQSEYSEKIETTKEKPENPTVIDIIYTGELEDVYDLNVEDNHNFYIITQTENSHYETKGILVHNCSEIILRSRQFCNLSEVVIRSNDDIKSLKAKIRLATIVGCFQSTLTNFKYISKKYKENCEEERLLGVSLTGIMDNRFTNGREGDLKKLLEELRLVAVDTAKEWSERLNISMPTAITCIKPSGTVSSLVDSPAGIHDRNSPFYIRTVRQDKKDPLSQFMIDMNIPYEDDVMKPDHTYVFSFPIKSPEDSIFKGDRSAIEQLEFWLTYQRYWCEHKPSITVSVRDSEWPEVGAWVWNHLDEMSGVSFLPFSDHIYKQSPYQECSKSEYEEFTKKMPKYVDWSKLSEYEKVDNTNSSQELACTGPNGGCDV